VFFPLKPNSRPQQSSAPWQAHGPRSNPVKKSGSEPKGFSGFIPCELPTPCSYPPLWYGRTSHLRVWNLYVWTPTSAKQPSRKGSLFCLNNGRTRVDNSYWQGCIGSGGGPNLSDSFFITSNPEHPVNPVRK